MLISFVVLSSCRTLKNAYGCEWELVFYHNSYGSVYFSSFSEALSCNMANKFSILGSMNETYKFNGKYEFLLEYPGVVGYNWWRQSLLPTSETENGVSATGYEPVSISWPGHQWGGLMRSTRTDATLLDGSRETGFWWFSIGCITKEFNPRIPGPYVNDSINHVVFEVKLWVKISDKPFTTSINAKRFQLLFLINAVLLTVWHKASES